MSAVNLCPDCGAPLPPDAPLGHCPRCLLRDGLASRTAGSTFAPEAPAEGSVLTMLTEAIGPIPRVLLRDTDSNDGPSPVSRLSSPEVPAPADRPGRLQFFGEIARGGMGAILKARDPDLGRELAVKVLLEAHRDDPDLVRRFVEEAQIGGQLQHPGVVPIHHLGTLSDRRPFFTMKLVKGRTLAALLEERQDPSVDLPRFLGIIEVICQTVAYAHARGVIHRDLKPSNVMVGAFGEVQVMDWGLAKVLPQGGVCDDEAAGRIDQETAIQTARSGSGADASRAGSVMGTPSYMAPEQARGEVERLDERVDVFALGSIVCEILTGDPAFTGRTSIEIQQKAARRELADALARLDTCQADSQLLDLARSCLAAEPQDRPRNAKAVSDRLTAYLSGVQERLKDAELARAAALARAVEERKRRRLTMALATSILITSAVIGGGLSYLGRQRSARLLATTRGVTEALAEAERLRGQAQSAAPGDVAKLSEALNVARRARGLLDEGEADEELRSRVAVVLADLAREHTAAEQRAAELRRDRKLLDRLETIRGSRSEHWDPKQADKEYAAAFREFGIDLDRLDPNEAGARIAQRSDPAELASYLDDWTGVRRIAQDKRDEASWRRLIAAARAADPDRWRNALRTHIGDEDLEALRKLAADDKALEAQPAKSLLLLAQGLQGKGDRRLAEQILRRAWGLDPSDFWVSLELAIDYGKRSPRKVREWFPHPEEALRYLSAAVAVRPRSSTAHNSLGLALYAQGKLEEAVTEFRKAIRFKPDGAGFHSNLGAALKDQGEAEEAIAACREAIRLRPDDAGAHLNLGAILCDLKRDYKRAETEFWMALQLWPDAAAHYSLGNALAGQGRLAEAIAEFKEAIRIEPDHPQALTNLGLALYKVGRSAEAIVEYRKAIQIDPDLYQAHTNLGLALDDQGKMEEAIVEYKKATQIKPDDAEVLGSLGIALRSQGHFDLAIAELRKARDLAGANPGLRQTVESELKATEREAALAARLPAVLRGEEKPRDAAEGLDFARLCGHTKHFAASARFYAGAFAADPALAENMQRQHRYSAACSAAHVGTGEREAEKPIDEKERTHWRKQAIEWLKTDLTFWRKQVEAGSSESAAFVKKTLQHWQVDPDLAGLRDEAGMAKLPADEQKACRALWSEVNALLARATQGKAP
jgi:serine/threonine-protein kinase